MTITVFLEVLIKIKKIWIIPHEAFYIFGWTFLDGFDVLKMHLHRLPARAAKVKLK